MSTYRHVSSDAEFYIISCACKVFMEIGKGKSLFARPGRGGLIFIRINSNEYAY
jgi:hypothetical protein